MLKVAVKYCGGCNPGYDRIALVGEIKNRLRGKVSLVPPGDKDVQTVLAIHGCETACAALGDFEGNRIWNVTCEEDARKFVKEILSLSASSAPTTRL